MADPGTSVLELLDDLGQRAEERAALRAGVTHIVLAAIDCPGPPGPWLAEHIIEPVLAQTI